MARTSKTQKTRSLVQDLLDGVIKADMDIGTIPARAAELLIRMQHAYPTDGIPWTYLYRAVTAETKLRPLEDPKVKSLKDASGRIRKILERDHQRTLFRNGDTIRATAEGEEFVEQAIFGAGMRVEHAMKALADKSALVTVSALPAGDTKKAFVQVRSFLKEANESKVFEKLGAARDRLLALKAEQTPPEDETPSPLARARRERRGVFGREAEAPLLLLRGSS